MLLSPKTLSSCPSGDPVAPASPFITGSAGHTGRMNQACFPSCVSFLLGLRGKREAVQPVPTQAPELRSCFSVQKSQEKSLAVSG